VVVTTSRFIKQVFRSCEKAAFSRGRAAALGGAKGAAKAQRKL